MAEEPGAEPFVLVGRYQLLERIGEGGMGVVWRSFDLDLEEQVAIKFLRENLASDESLRACFRREVKLARRVTHPNVARVFEFGRDGDLYFLTMEFIQGEALDRLIEREGSFPRDKAPSLAVSLCRGLAAAHAAGVVHGDLKPGNVLLAQGRGAVLTDFGIARALSEVEGRDELVRGTLEYMAPEQLAGEPLGLQSDVYSMGLVFFEALTGKTPWSGMATKEVFEDKLGGAEPDIRRLAPDLPREWLDLIGDCLRTDPKRRPEDARALLQRVLALRTALRTREAGAPQGLDDSMTNLRLHRPPTKPLATGSWPRWIEILPFDVQPAAAREGVSRMASDMVDALTQVRGLRVAAAGVDPRGPIERRTQVRGEVRAADDGLIVSVRIVDSGSAEPEAEFVVHQPRAALDNLGFELASRIVAKLDPPRPPAAPVPRYGRLDSDTTTLYQRAREASEAMRFDEAVPLFEAAIARAPGHRLLHVEHTLARVKQVFAALGEATPAEVASLRQAVEAVVVEYDDFAEAHLAHAWVALATNDLRGAATSARRALARAPNLAMPHVLLADLLLDIGRLPDAERRLDIALALDRNNSLAWTTKARLTAYQGAWGEFYGMISGELTSLHYRSVHVPRLMQWRPNRAAFAWIEPVYAKNLDRLPEPLCALARELVAFGLQREDRRAVLERVVQLPSSGHPRQKRFVGEIVCELACLAGDLDRARATLAAADLDSLADWYWVDQCPAIAGLRADPMFATVRERVRANADAVAEAIWS